MFNPYRLKTEKKDLKQFLSILWQQQYDNKLGIFDKAFQITAVLFCGTADTF